MTLWGTSPVLAQNNSNLGLPKTTEVVPVRIETINSQEILIVSNGYESIQIVYNDDVKESIIGLFDAPVGKSVKVKDPEGNTVSSMHVESNMKPAIYFRNIKNKTVSVYIREMEAVLKDDELSGKRENN